MCDLYHFRHICSSQSFLLFHEYSSLGTTGGYSCEDVARRNMFHIGVEGDLPDVHCTQSGVCTGTQRW